MASPALSIRQGPRAGTVFALSAGLTRLGRDDGCDVVLDDPTVSGRHADLARTDNGVVLRDAGSLNGTYLNGRPCRQATLVEGDEVWIGKFHFTFGDLPGSAHPSI
jgi:pSer/pThr/pTyr-binding forkhead associated (FHA) protein